MTYQVNEIFYSIQGEGYWSGRPAVFCRFSGCNLWNGQEQDRAAAICTFCDTTFVDYEEFSLDQLVDEVSLRWPSNTSGQPMVVFTGGEPLRQLDERLVDGLKMEGFYTALETNGTLPLEARVDWVCVSPKTPSLRITSGDELKLVYPQQRIVPWMFTGLNFDHFWLSPMDGPNLQENTEAAFRYCLDHPQWRLNIQTHKVIGQP
jgi:7-carboxy-7-deazaguanine synthase